MEDKYLSMKYVKGWEEEEDDYALFTSPAKKKGHKNNFNDSVATVERLDTRQRVVLTTKEEKDDSKDKSDKKETQKPKKDIKGKGKTDMSKMKML